MDFDPYRIRAQFPALRREVGGRPAVYLDGPGGTQVPDSVIAAMASVLEDGVSNLGGGFDASRRADQIVDEAREAMADLLGADPLEIVFGQNMTSLTMAASRALSRSWGTGDAVVVTRLDHDANVWPWVVAARERGAEVRWVDFDPADGCRLDTDSLRSAIDEHVRLVAVTGASNALGTIVDTRLVARLAHEVGALVYVDAVHLTPHAVIDVRALGCDFLAASAYKFYGPHVGVLFGRRELLAGVEPYKIRPAPDDPPASWETGTQSFESLAGVTAAVDHLAGLAGPDHPTRRAALVAGIGAVAGHERDLAQRFIDGLGEIETVTLYGVPEAGGRTPTFAVEVAGVDAATVARRLGEHGIFTWAGHYYAVEVMRRLGKLDAGGLLRIGFAQYTTPREVDLVLEALAAIASGHELGSLDVLQAPGERSGELSPYRSFESDGLAHPRDLPRRRIAEGLVDIVDAEGPVTTDRAFSVYVRAAGGKKVTRSVREDLEWAVEWLVGEGRLAAEVYPAADGPQTVIRLPGRPRVLLRRLGDRDLYTVPIDEVAELARRLAAGGGESGEVLKREVLDAYGLKRLTDLADRYLDAAFRLAGV